MSLIPVKNTFPFKIKKTYDNTLEFFDWNSYDENTMYIHNSSYRYHTDYNTVCCGKTISESVMIARQVKTLEDAKQIVLEHYNKNKSI